MEASQRIKNRTSYTILEYGSKNSESYQKHTVCPRSRLHLSHESSAMETVSMSINRQMDNENMMHIYCGILVTHKEK